MASAPSPEREARRDWWLALLAEGEALSANFVASLGTTVRMAGDIMSTPVVSVAPDTDVTEIARDAGGGFGPLLRAWRAAQAAGSRSVDDAKAAWRGAIQRFEELGDTKSATALHRRIAHLESRGQGHETNGAAPADAPAAPEHELSTSQ